MNLELKHIAAYLPYKLKVRVVDFESDYVGKEYDTVIGLHQWSRDGRHWSVLTEGGAKPSIAKVQPVLRPLLDFMDDETLAGELSDVLSAIYPEHFIRSIMNEGRYSIEWQKITELMEFLNKNHADYMGLIPSGLAVNINEI